MTHTLNTVHTSIKVMSLFYYLLKRIRPLEVSFCLFSWKQNQLWTENVNFIWITQWEHLPSLSLEILFFLFGALSRCCTGCPLVSCDFVSEPASSPGSTASLSSEAASGSSPLATLSAMHVSNSSTGCVWCGGVCEVRGRVCEVWAHLAWSEQTHYWGWS